MENSDLVNALISIINALNTVETKGKNNLGALSGSISVLEDILNKTIQKQKEDSIELSQTGK